MESAERQRGFARRAFRASVVVGLAVIAFFVIRNEFVTALVLGSLLIGGGYLEYRRRVRDLERIDGEADEDPFERRERYR